MTSLTLPDASFLNRYLQTQGGLPYTYHPVGNTKHAQPVAWFNNDSLRIQIGQGGADFKLAKEAIRRWRMFPDAWTRIFPEGAPIRESTTVAMHANVLGLWWRNACRVVYTVDEPVRFGFAYGTLPGHVEKGEEWFGVELDEAGKVWYEIRAFSRPRHLLAWLGYPYIRFLQDKFRRDSAAQMLDFLRPHVTK